MFCSTLTPYRQRHLCCSAEHLVCEDRALAEPSLGAHCTPRPPPDCTPGEQAPAVKRHHRSTNKWLALNPIYYNRQHMKIQTPIFLPWQRLHRSKEKLYKEIAREANSYRWKSFLEESLEHTNSSPKNRERGVKTVPPATPELLHYFCNL